MNVTIWPSVYQPAEGRRVSFGALVERVKSPRWYGGRDDVGRWSAATFRENYRNGASFIDESAIVTDVGDHAPVALEALERVFAGVLGFAYASWSSTPEAPRWRVVLILSRRIDAGEHNRVIRFVFHMQERAGIAPDFDSKDAPHPWALPARHDGDGYEHVDLVGDPLDVDKALAMFPEPQLEPLARPGPREDSYSKKLERASKYLARMPGAIAGSGGHRATFAAAVKMARGFGLDFDDVLRLLVEDFNPRCAPPWSRAELRHKARQAVQRGRLPAGYLADRPMRGGA